MQESEKQGDWMRGGAEMAGKRQEITCRSFVIMPDGRTVPVEDLTDSERETWHAHMRERLSTGLSAYYSQHPEEYARLRCGRVEEEGA